MKSSKEIKKELHEYIDSIDDEETLWMVREDVVEYLKKEKLEDNEEEDVTEEIPPINRFFLGRCCWVNVLCCGLTFLIIFFQIQR